MAGSTGINGLRGLLTVRAPLFVTVQVSGLKSVLHMYFAVLVLFRAGLSQLRSNKSSAVSSVDQQE